MIPEDSRVEIDAKITPVFHHGKVMNMAELNAVQGRSWDDIEHKGEEERPRWLFLEERP